AEHVRRAGGRVEPLGAAAWGTLHTLLDAPVVLTLAGEPRRIIAWLDRAEALACAVSIAIAALGQGGTGVPHLALHGVTPGALPPRDAPSLRARSRGISTCASVAAPARRPAPRACPSASSSRRHGVSSPDRACVRPRRITARSASR